MAGILNVDSIQNSAGTVILTPRNLQRRLIQRTTRRFFGGTWTPATNYREIPGSVINITPMYDNSLLTYTFMGPICQKGSNAHSISHWIFMANGQEYARHCRSVDHQESGAVIRWEVASWGAGRSSSMGYFARQYVDATHAVHFNSRRYIDGSDSTRAVPTWVSVEEYLPAP